MNGGGQFGELREDEVRGKHCEEYDSEEYGCKSLTKFAMNICHALQRIMHILAANFRSAFG